MIKTEIAGLLLLLTGLLVMTGVAIRARSQNDKWLRLALTSMHDAIVTTNKQARITAFNTVAEALTGRKEKEALGRNISDMLTLVDYDTRLPVENPVGQVIKTSGPVRRIQNTLLIGRDGSERPIDGNAALIGGVGSRIQGAILIFRDVTERYRAEKKLLESEERLKAVTNAARIGLVMIDRERRYVYANNFYLQMLDIAHTHVIGKRVGEVLPVIYEQIRKNLDRAFAGERLNYEVKGIHKKEQGLGRTYSVTYEPQKRQSLVMHVVIVVVDITDIQPPPAENNIRSC